jgi:hypothetical protein
MGESAGKKSKKSPQLTAWEGPRDGKAKGAAGGTSKVVARRRCYKAVGWLAVWVR